MISINSNLLDDRALREIEDDAAESLSQKVAVARADCIHARKNDLVLNLLPQSLVAFKRGRSVGQVDVVEGGRLLDESSDLRQRARRAISEVEEMNTELLVSGAYGDVPDFERFVEEGACDEACQFGELG